mmetsp:Transcript_2706/g.5829  ORF Transcript_2706/g.5829 Transcript_2706/m.5829 type:complete len:577 (+) Transcript_2706:96-1826(+)|eukprot:CAMPEP_0168168840 /NCGR_PEP_ID=MMETSP0139_2-20121125/3321_1 /TAXON_ID=44445 /ORGANISM="Pseudo-nitzschia australis, Strain 10249 10 AB" /LENGTH=576 /DNA_ID=CAMNT_0008086223 /DNA_START=11 /DNA_END=1741 /DNA_ORIENTATION=+
MTAADANSIQRGKNEESSKSDNQNYNGGSVTKVARAISLMEEYSHVVKHLEGTETWFRLKHLPALLNRAPPLEVDDVKDLEHQQQKKKHKQQEEQPAPITATISESDTVASLRRLELKEIFTINETMIPKTLLLRFRFESILTLDVSHNELTDLPGLSLFKNLQILNLNRNWFNTLPSEIGTLKELRTLIASRNFLRPNNQSLRLDALRQSARQLATMDLRYNQKCGRPFHRDKVRDELLPLTPSVQMTLWEELGATPGTYVGSSAAVRDPILLRSQLEPLGTVALRKRLVCDFGRAPTSPSEVDRAGVMRDLLKAYFDEGMAYFPENIGTNTDPDYDALIANRTTLQLHGAPVPQAKLDGLLEELKKWTSYTGLVNKNRERPSIHASNYMILRRPKSREELASKEESRNDGDGNGDKKSRRAIRKAKKLERYRPLWELGISALREVDPVFADQKCTEIAITYGFSGSPHLDKQNCGPFYGLSLGSFDNADGNGGIVVESSARVVVQMNTKHRLGRVDGRYVHWVKPWGGKQQQSGATVNENEQEQEERYSLIYYETGNDFVKPGPAVFSIPTDPI